MRRLSGSMLAPSGMPNVPVAVLPMREITDCPLGVAIEVATTTVVLLVLRRTDGRIVGMASAFNRQSDLGDNVLTRINRCWTAASSTSWRQSADTSR